MQPYSSYELNRVNLAERSSERQAIRQARMLKAAACRAEQRPRRQARPATRPAARLEWTRRLVPALPHALRFTYQLSPRRVYSNLP